jgi:DNA polymerase-3 subunit delta'
MASLLDSIRGNQNVHATLLEAHMRGRLAPTLLFSGPSGVGKRLFAMALAQTLVCENLRQTEMGPRACGDCGACHRIEKVQSESLLVVEPDGAQIKIEQARDILQFTYLQRLGRARIIVIDQAHLLNNQAANALLKSLEEPPVGTYFILITALAASLLATIRSRTQTVRFRALTDDEIAEVLAGKADPWVVDAAQGSVETALRLSESVDEFRELNEAALAFVSAALTHFPLAEVARLKDLLKEKSSQGFVGSLFLAGLRNALRLQTGLPPRTAQKGWIDFAAAAAGFAPVLLGQLTDSALALPHEMARNIDRSLLLENFALDLGYAAARLSRRCSYQAGQ